MKQRLQRFMRGRYGADEFNRFIGIISLVFFLFGLLADAWLFYWLGIFMLAYSYYRMFSRNVLRRSQENAAFYQLKQAATLGFSTWRQKMRTEWQQKKQLHTQKKTHRFYRCPRCGQQLRVPRGKGKIEITCPACQTTFLGKT